MSTAIARGRSLAESGFEEKTSYRPPINVGQAERLASLAGGAMLAGYGLTRGTSAGLLLGAIGAAFAYRGWTGHCSVYQALGMNSAEHSDQTAIPSGQGIKLEESITIGRPAEELFQFWRKLDNLPRVMRHVASVEQLSPTRSRWKAQGLTAEVEWEADIIEERENEMISWRSREGSTIGTAGSVHFRPAPGDRGTEVRVVLSYNPPGGRAGHALAWLAGRDPASQVREDLRKFKQIMETSAAAESP
ncbi:MAG TPA: SRPBCC family protein [Pirellulaceae bacterium]|nr:SRPBCC family protein [Pirellulaceae bacterium]